MIIRQEEGAEYVSVEHKWLNYRRYSAEKWEVKIQEKWWHPSQNGLKEVEQAYQNQKRIHKEELAA